MQSKSPEPKPSSAEKLNPHPLTDQILDTFQKRLIESSEIDEHIVEQLLQIARGSAKPKAKDIEKLLKPKEISE
jgi:hypothetical protein